MPIKKMNAMKKYLVTGGAGFIGANFVKYILDNGAMQPRYLFLTRLLMQAIRLR